MEELVDAGKIRFIGVSNFSIGELKRAQSALSKYRIVANQVRYSLIERTIEDGLLKYCQENAITIIAFSPLGTSFAQFRRADPQGELNRIATTTGENRSSGRAELADRQRQSGDNSQGIDRGSRHRRLRCIRLAAVRKGLCVIGNENSL